MAADVAVDHSRDEWDRVAVAAEKRDSEKHVIERVVVAGIGDPNPAIAQEVFCHGDGFLVEAWHRQCLGLLHELSRHSNSDGQRSILDE